MGGLAMSKVFFTHSAASIKSTLTVFHRCFRPIGGRYSLCRHRHSRTVLRDGATVDSKSTDPHARTDKQSDVERTYLLFADTSGERKLLSINCDDGYTAEKITGPYCLGAGPSNHSLGIFYERPISMNFRNCLMSCWER